MLVRGTQGACPATAGSRLRRSPEAAAILVRGSWEHAHQRPARLPSSQRPAGGWEAAAMLVRGAPHLSSLALSRGTLEDIPLLTWLCFPAALRVALKDTNGAERGAHYCLQRPRQRLEVGDGEPDSGLGSAPPPGFHSPEGIWRPQTEPSAPPRPFPHPGPAPRSQLAAGACNRLAAPPQESSSGAPSPPPARPGGWAPGRLDRPAALTRRPWPEGSSGDPPAAARTLAVRRTERAVRERAGRSDVGFRGQDGGECGGEPGGRALDGTGWLRGAGSGRGPRAVGATRPRGHCPAPPAVAEVGPAGGPTLLGRGGD